MQYPDTCGQLLGCHTLERGFFVVVPHKYINYGILTSVNCRPFCR